MLTNVPNIELSSAGRGGGQYFLPGVKLKLDSTGGCWGGGGEMLIAVVASSYSTAFI